MWNGLHYITKRQFYDRRRRGVESVSPGHVWVVVLAYKAGSTKNVNFPQKGDDFFSAKLSHSRHIQHPKVVE